MSQNGIGSKHGTFALDGQLFNDRIIRSSNGIKLLSLDTLKLSSGTSGDLVILIVVLIEEAAPCQIFDLFGLRVVDEVGQG